MSASPTVVVKKGGVLSALVTGVFGLLIVGTLCGAALGWYALNVIDRRAGDVVGIGQGFFESLPQWRDSLPMLAEVLDDHRAPDYLQRLEASVRVIDPGKDQRRSRVVVAVKNHGSEVVTLLTGRVVLLDDDGEPLNDETVFIATPIAVPDDGWRGPLQPGAERKFAVRGWRDARDVSAATIELTDIRVWNGPAPAASAPTAPTAAAAGP